jgi:hypothetical protein
VHDGVGDCWDIIPTKWWAKETEVDTTTRRGEELEDKNSGVGGWEEKGPIKVSNVGTMEEDGGAGA